MSDIEQERTGVYRLYDVGDLLLYVGVGVSAIARLENHRQIKSWWDDVHHAKIVWFDNRADALREESMAIASENPLHNIAGTGKEFRKLGPPFAEGSWLAGAAEIAKRLNISRQRVQQITEGPDFPCPYSIISAGRIWRSADIDQWIEDTRRHAGTK